MQKEWVSWQKFQAVEELSDEEVKALPGDTKIIGTRWVHTDKNSKPRLIAYHMAKKTGKTKEQVDKEYPFEAKLRLVVQGCQEDETNIRSDSPTCSFARLQPGLHIGDPVSLGDLCLGCQHCLFAEQWDRSTFDPALPKASSSWSSSYDTLQSTRQHLWDKRRWQKLVDETFPRRHRLWMDRIQARNGPVLPL